MDASAATRNAETGTRRARGRRSPRTTPRAAIHPPTDCARDLQREMVAAGGDRQLMLAIILASEREYVAKPR
jgi:hypothetical protein